MDRETAIARIEARIRFFQNRVRLRAEQGSEVGQRQLEHIRSLQDKLQELKERT